MDHPIIIITGASRGLGAAAARAAAQMGADVVLAARTEAALQNEVQQIGQAGGQALAITADISREADCERIVERTLAEFGRIDALINNAGVIEPIAPLSKAWIDDWQRSWAINVLAPVMLIRDALPALRKVNGRVLNITTGAVNGRIPGWGGYSTSKAALNVLTQQLAGEEPAVTSVALRPGVADTAMQVTIRETGRGNMGDSNYEWLNGLHRDGKLLPVEIPGRVMACLALFAPHEWSGEALSWDEERVQALVKAHDHPK